MNKFSFLVISSLFLLSCGGSGSDAGGEGESKLEAVKSSINLRLGQIAQLDSPVAVSAALQNGESIVIFNRTDGNTKLFHVAYRSNAGETLLVIFSSEGRPLSAETIDAKLTFSNYTRETVDVTLVTGVTSRTLLNQPIDPDSISFLEGDTMLRILLGLDKDVDAGTRGLLAAAFSSLKVIGCMSDGLLRQFQSFENFVPAVFSSVSALVCPSQLLDSILGVLNSSGYKNITVKRLSNFPECLLPFSFQNESICAEKLAAENVNAAVNGYVGDYPRPTPRPQGSSSPETSPTLPVPGTPEPTATPTPTPPEPQAPPPPGKSPNLGRWAGIGAGSTQVTGCRNYQITFSVGVQGSDLCESPNVCGLAGMMNDIEDPFVDVGINGNVDKDGNFTFFGAQSSPVPISVTGSGILKETDGQGVFQISNFNCTGMITVTRP